MSRYTFWGWNWEVSVKPPVKLRVQSSNSIVQGAKSSSKHWVHSPANTHQPSRLTCEKFQGPQVGLLTIFKGPVLFLSIRGLCHYMYCTVQRAFHVMVFSLWLIGEFSQSRNDLFKQKTTFLFLTASPSMTHAKCGPWEEFDTQKILPRSYVRYVYSPTNHARHSGLVLF